MLIGSYRDGFTAIASSAAALTGLLFVAISVSPGRLSARSPVIVEVRAAAALLGFSSALTISLFGLVPGTNIGYPASALGIGGLLFTAAALRSIWHSDTPRDQKAGQFGLAALLIAIFGTYVGCGIDLLLHPHDISVVQLIAYAMVAAILVGIARAWELVGNRDTGLAASLRELMGHPSSFDLLGGGGPPDPSPPGNGTAGGSPGKPDQGG